MSSADFNEGSGRSHPESPNPKELVEASERIRDGLHARALAIARSGHTTYHPLHNTPVTSRNQSPVPHTAADTLMIMAYYVSQETPARDKRLVMLITHSEAVGTPDIQIDEQGSDAYYSMNRTRYKFLETPDGLRITKDVELTDKPSERPPSSVVRVSEQWELAVAALRNEQKAEDERKALEHEPGSGGFFSQQDAEDLEALMDRVWPQAGNDTPASHTS